MCHIISIYRGKWLWIYFHIMRGCPVIITRAHQYLMPQCKIILWYSDLFVFGKGWDWVYLVRRPLLAHWTSPGWWVWSTRWNEWQGKPKYSEETCPSATLSATNSTTLIRIRTWAATVRSRSELRQDHCLLLSLRPGDTGPSEHRRFPCESASP
jgi:hypothetical protein